MSAITAEASVISQKIDWARDHLFNSRGNTILSIAGLALWAAFAFLIIKFVFFDANWGLVALNRRLFFVGSYPSDELWRIWIPVFLTAALAAFSYGVWGGSLRPYFISVGAAAFLLLVLGLGSDAQITETPFTDTIRASDGSTTVVSGLDKDLVLETGWAPRWLYALSFGLALPFGASWLLLAGVFGTLGGAAVLGRRVASWGGSPVVLQAVGASWVLLIPFALLLQYGVPTIQLESAFLDVLVFTVGGFFSFFIGLVLALARISPYRAVRLTAVGYIEVVRAGPLLVWLLFATFLKDELGPGWRGVQQYLAGLPHHDRLRLLWRCIYRGGDQGRPAVDTKRSVRGLRGAGPVRIRKVPLHHPPAGACRRHPGDHRTIHRPVGRTRLCSRRSRW